MSENSLPPESQRQRWIKYGANVVLTSILVIVIAGLIVYLAERSKRRIDMTASGDYSLKPQTLNLIKDNKQKIKIISLYSRQKPTENRTQQVETQTGVAKADPVAQAQAVADLLEEYRSRGANIEIEEIDPVLNPSKADDLIRSVTEKYGSQIAKYRDFTDPEKGYPKTYEKIYALTKSEIEELRKLPLDQLKSQELVRTLRLVIDTVNDFPTILRTSESLIRPRLKLNPPDYKGVADVVQTSMQEFSDQLNDVESRFGKLKGDKEIPESIRQYMTDSLQRYQAMKKLADDLITQGKSLGELKLDTLREALGQPNAILVTGDNEWRVISHDQVWHTDNRDARALVASSETQVRPRFAGEQMISSAILSLNAKSKPKVVFIRPGGAPLTTPVFPPFQPSGPLSFVADRLREYNFEVLEKDISGQYATQAKMQGMPAQPEPSDEDIKDAIWIVLAVPAQQNQMGMPPPSVAPKLLEHLMNKGSAMLLFMPGAENLSAAIGDWGIDVKTDMLAVHEPIKTSGRESNDFVDQARKVPVIFILNDLGDHPLVAPLKSLDTAMLRPLVITTKTKPGYTATSIIPIPQSPKSWGETDLDGTMQNATAEFNPDKGDIASPLFSGAAAEKKDGGRIVAIGSIDFAVNGDGRSQGPVEMLDADLYLKRGIPALRFPGNGDLFVNSVFWLAKMDPMIAISPAAMEVSRIGPMSDNTLRGWRVGVLLIGLPGLVILAGLFVYFTRRD